MTDKIPLCVHCVENYLSDNVTGKTIHKDQCSKCYDDPVSIINFIFFIFFRGA